MAKVFFSKDDCVRGKKWNGDSFIGVYEYKYDDGSHCVMDASSGKLINVKVGDIHHAKEDEIKEIKKLLKERKTVEKEVEEIEDGDIAIAEDNNELDDACASV